MRSDHHRRQIKNDRHDDYSHSMYTSIPEPDANTSRITVFVYGWLALLIAAALIGYSLFSLPTDPSDNNPDEKPKVYQAPI